MNQQLIESPVNITQEDIKEQFNRFENGSCYPEIANLLALSLKNAPSELSQRIFGYIPGLFREVAITNPMVGITSAQLYIDEPVIYKVSFPGNHTMKGIPFFYLFCYLKENSSHLNVYFQSATKTSKNLRQQEYTISQQKIKFEGIISAFKDPESAICISDPGHFIPGLISSFYVGNRQINFSELISNLVESICISANIKLENTFLFGSSAGGMGALLSSTYFSQKVQVLSVNAQIITYDRVKVMNTLLETSDRDTLLKKFANRISCLNRFQQNINSVPNIYLLANINDDLYHRNYKFYQLYQKLFIAKGKNHQSIFDSYSGVEGHSRPDKVSLKKKIEVARAVLMMNSNYSSNKLNESASTTTHNNKIVNQKIAPLNRIAKRNQRLEYLKNTLDLSQLEILEIGAFDNPTFNKKDFNVFYCDYFSKEELIKNHGSNKPKRTQNAVDVDYIIKDSSFDQHINKKFDLIVANHVVEHVPNLIEWLRNIALILKKDGFLFLTIPHKEYIFDKLRPVTNLRELLCNYYENIQAPTINHIADQIYYYRPIKAENIWSNNYQHLLHKKRFDNVRAALDKAKMQLDMNAYVDTHCNVFTYESFLDIINEIEQAKYTTLSLHSSQDIIKPSNEFYVLLKNSELQFSSVIDSNINAKTTLETKENQENNYPEVGEVSADNSAIAGKEGWFFINSGTNYLTEYHTGAKRLPLLKVDQWEQLLTQRIEWHQSRKIAYQHIFVPNKIAVYPEYHPHSLDIQGDRPILQLQKKCHQLFAYPLELFAQYKDQYQLYEKQDSHWNFWGCYLAYQLLCQKLKISPDPRLISSPVETTKSLGDLGAKFGLTEMTLAKKLKLNSKIIYDNQVINHAHQGSVRVLQNDHIAHGKMIIFGDSFCNPGIPDYSADKRLTARLSTLFAENLNEVHFVWTPWVDYDYIEREKPDFVLTEMAERFLVRVPDDHDHLPLEEFVAEKLKEFGVRNLEFP
jgi:2-polyprenyl-3-methyl-5-hydroxy-6-metoxy-1,4-benzoquinol methylase